MHEMHFTDVQPSRMESCSLSMRVYGLFGHYLLWTVAVIIHRTYHALLYGFKSTTRFALYKQEKALDLKIECLQIMAEVCV